MQDDDGPKTATSGDDHEQAEALSRAAREAVRQPADPRLERSFAKLGLFADDESPIEKTPVPPPPTESTPPPPTVVGSAAPPVDLEPLRATLTALQASTERLEQRLATVTLLLIGLAVATAIVLLLVLLG